MRGKGAQLCRKVIGIWLLPAAPEKRVRLGGIEIEAVTVRGKKRYRLLPRVPRPRLSVEALDYAEFWFQPLTILSMARNEAGGGRRSPGPRRPSGRRPNAWASVGDSASRALNASSLDVAR
jgi:hypothetical protein